MIPPCAKWELRAPHGPIVRAYIMLVAGDWILQYVHSADGTHNEGVSSEDAAKRLIRFWYGNGARWKRVGKVE